MPLCAEGTSDFDMIGMELVYNNLGGLGPNKDDPEELRFEKLTSNIDDPDHPGTPFTFQMVITNLTAYHLTQPKLNGIAGSFVQLAISEGVTRFRVQLVADLQNNPLPAPIRHPFFTFFDFDHPVQNKYITNETCGETIQFPGNQIRKIHGNTTDLVKVHKAKDGTVTASARKWGARKDNPTEPTALTQAQLDKAIGVEAATTAATPTFEFIIGIVNIKKAARGVMDRDCTPMKRMFQLAGFSAAKVCDTSV